MILFFDPDGRRFGIGFIIPKDWEYGVDNIKSGNSDIHRSPEIVSKINGNEPV